MAFLFLFKDKQKLLILLQLNDFMTCIFNIQSEWLNISALEHCRKLKFSIYVHQTLMYTKCEQCYA